jgi:hypothetical protein
MQNEVNPSFKSLDPLLILQYSLVHRNHVSISDKEKDFWNEHVFPIPSHSI